MSVTNHEYNLLKRQLSDNQAIKYQYGSSSVVLDGTERQDPEGISYQGNYYRYEDLSHPEIITQTSDSTSKTNDSIDPNTIISNGVEKALKQSGIVTDEASPRERLTTWLETSK